jgi:uncharacterized metal-binding protein YceD (DUF177 family)
LTLSIFSLEKILEIYGVSEMKHNREFEIAWQGLKPGIHEFQYNIDNRFMLEHGEHEQEYSDLDVQVKLRLDKQTNFFLLHLDVDGSMVVPCDRCGDEFSLRLWDEFDFIIKLAGEEATEIDDEDDVVFIPRTETVIDISPWLYEYVKLSIPLQRIHPEQPDGTSGCNANALDLLQHLTEEEQHQQVNNIWKGLDALKGKIKRKSK